MALPTILTRTPVVDSNGMMTKPWLDFLQGTVNTANTANANASSSAAPGVVSAITVSGAMDPVQGIITLTVGVDPPTDTGDTFAGCHLYLEIPDQSSNTAQVAGGTAVGSAAVTGTWQPIDLGLQPYVAAQQPWTIVLSIPTTIDPTQSVNARIYAVSYSHKVQLPLVQANQLNATPNQLFTLTSQPSSLAGTTVTATSGNIVAQALPPDNSTGKLKTPVQVLVGEVPTNIPGWCYQIVVTLGFSDPTNPANQFVVTGLETVAGPVPPTTPDGISTSHTFTFDTPATIQSATVWLQSGLVDGNGNFTPNPIVPGITPSFPIEYGTLDGTVDAAQMIISSIDATMGVSGGQFGIAPGGVGSTQIANLAVGTAHIQNLAVTNGQMAFGTIGAAQIGLLAVIDANIANCNVSKLQAGTAIFSGTVTLQRGATGPAVVMDSSSITLSQGSGATSKLKLTATQAVLTQDGTNGITLNSSGQIDITVNNLGIQLGSSGGNDIACGSVFCNGELEVLVGTLHINGPGLSATSATSGGASALPATPAGYVKIWVGATEYKLPYYNL